MQNAEGTRPPERHETHPSGRSIALSTDVAKGPPAASTPCRTGYLVHEDEVGAAPQASGNAAAAPCRQDDVVVVAEFQLFQHRLPGLRCHQRQVAQEVVTVARAA